MAERVGFEPTIGVATYDDLANRSFQPAHAPLLFRDLLCNLKSLNIQY